MMLLENPVPDVRPLRGEGEGKSILLLEPALGNKPGENGQKSCRCSFGKLERRGSVSHGAVRLTVWHRKRYVVL